MGWPVEHQHQALSEVGFDGPIYDDTLTCAHLGGRNVAALEERADMLRPTSRTMPEVILVASIRVLALSPVDLTAALAAASGRHATIRALDTGMEIAPDAGAAEIAAAAAAWDKARRDDQTREARGMGNEAAVRAAERRREAWLAIAAPCGGCRLRRCLPPRLPSVPGCRLARCIGFWTVELQRNVAPKQKRRKRT